MATEVCTNCAARDAMPSHICRSDLCKPCWVERAVRRTPAVQVPGKRRTAVMRQGATLSVRAFNEGWTILDGFYRMPKDEQPKDTYYEAVQYDLSDNEWMRAVRHFVREQKAYRCPSPQEMVDAVAGLRRVRLEGGPEPSDPYAGHWSFVCHGCGYRKLSSHPSNDPPEFCSRCADDRHADYEPSLTAEEVF